MFDLYGLNGEKKLSNIGQCGQVYGNFPITTPIKDNNLIGASLVVVSFIFEGNFNGVISSIGITSDLFVREYIYTLHFDKNSGTLSMQTTVPDKTKVKITGYTYIK